MGGTSIDDQENRSFGAGDEALEKFNEDSGIDTALLLDHEPHLASRGDRRDKAHTISFLGTQSGIRWLTTCARRPVTGTGLFNLPRFGGAFFILGASFGRRP